MYGRWMWAHTTVCVESLSSGERNREREMCLEGVVAALAVAGVGGAHRPLRARREQEVMWNFFDALKFSRNLEEGMR